MSTDFNGVNPAQAGIDPTPVVTLKKVSAIKRTVLVLDVSGSMERENRIIRLAQVQSVAAMSPGRP